MSIARNLIKRTLSWSIRSTLPRPICVPTPSGFRFWVHPKDWVSFTMASGIHERSEIQIFRKLHLEPGTVADVGSNLGFFSLLFSKIYPSCSVQAVEPNPYARTRMQANLAVNQNLSRRITLHECAAGESEGIVKLSCRLGLHAHAWGTVWQTMWNNSNTVTQNVNLRRLDDLIAPPLRLLKIDVEGYELEVLKGAERLLRDKPIIMLEVALGYLIQRPGVYQDELEFAANHGYDLFVAEHGRFVPYELGQAPLVNLWLIPEEMVHQGHAGSVPILAKSRTASSGNCVCQF